MDTIEEVLTRGVEAVLPNKEGLAVLMRKRKIRLYNGIDPTGGQLHLGHSLVLRKLQQFQDLGHEVILLVGTFTAQIGDPSDRESPRQPLTLTQIKKNMKTYKDQASKIIDFSKVKMRYNADWLSKLNFEELVKLASCFTIQQLIERNMFQKRLKENKPVWLHEFMYPLMQGYDSVHMNVDLEVGGTDQTFNMLAGRILQKIYNKKEKYVLTTPILEGTDGRKMSKTFNNYIALMDLPNEMFGKVMALKDELIIRYFELCTDIPLEEIRKMDKELRKEIVNPMDLKKRLAREIVTTYHSTTLAEKAEEEFEKVFQKRKLPSKAPTKHVAPGQWLVIDLLVETGLCPSKSETKRLIKQGAVEVDGRKLLVSSYQLSVKDGMIIRVGKRKFVKLIINH